MRRLFLAVFVGILAAGCGGGSSKMADKPTADEIKKVEEADKQVEQEERGTPVKAKGKGR